MTRIVRIQGVETGTVWGSCRNSQCDGRAKMDARHHWRWHATGAGMGWVCDRCGGHHRFTTDEDRPPETGCGCKPNDQVQPPAGDKPNTVES